MRQTSKVEGTKIAQAAKDLNVTSVTIRRYLSEFNIETTTDENGIKVLPDQALEELKTVRRLKEDGLTNPKVMEELEESRAKRPGGAKPKVKEAAVRVGKKVVEETDEAQEDVQEVQAPKVERKRPVRRAKTDEVAQVEPVAEEVSEEETLVAESGDAEGGDSDSPSDINGEARPKHSLTCQTCGKVFEHMNPRLRDCLDCYRTKRKERRRGGSDRHKNVIQHPIAQQAVSKAAQTNHNAESFAPPPSPLPVPQPPMHQAPSSHAPSFQAQPPQAQSSHQSVPQPQSAAIQRGPVRNYRKAIEETRHITGSLKRRLERPDLPEGDRRWLEQIYAYQLILHQGWRHLSDYKNNSNPANKSEE